MAAPNDATDAGSRSNGQTTSRSREQARELR